MWESLTGSDGGLNPHPQSDSSSQFFCMGKTFFGFSTVKQKLVPNGKIRFISQVVKHHLPNCGR